MYDYRQRAVGCENTLLLMLEEEPLSDDMSPGGSFFCSIEIVSKRKGGVPCNEDSWYA